MVSRPSFVLRAVSTVVTCALALTGLSVLAAAPAAAVELPVYSSLPDSMAPNVVSLGYQARSTDEFGDYIQLAGTDRAITNVSVGMSSWACQTNSPCVTTPGATYTHPITVNIYEVDNSGAVPVAGALISSVTQAQKIPYRPSSDSTCSTPTAWRAANGSCYNGYAFTLDFDFGGVVVPTDIVVTVAYNTNSHGAAPIGANGPYESLNVGLRTSGTLPTVGTDENVDEVFWDTLAGSYADGGAGGTDTLRVDTGWSSNPGLLIEIDAEAATPAPTAAVTVYEKDVKGSETPATYLDWHEGNPSATAANSYVSADGLELASTSASTVIKGIDASTTPATRTRLTQLITSASVAVEEGSVTFQVPVFYGTVSSPHFTTLRSTSLSAGSSFSQSDTWATTQAFGPFAAQQEAPLGELLSALYQAAGSTGGVGLAGFGVQADAPARVSSIVWDGTTYSFSQPTLVPCTPPLAAGPAASNLDSNGWTFSQTRAKGHNQFVAGGLRIYTEDSSTLSKAAGYHPIDIALADVGTVGIEFAAGFDKRPGLQLAFDKDGDGGFDGYLVGEPWANFVSGDGWSLTTDGDWNKAQFWNSNAALGLPDGWGYPNAGTLADYLSAWPSARITSYGYSLGSGVFGDATITSITVGCQTSTFSTAVAAAPTATVTVNEYDISADADPYAGWHEGYSTNTGRSFSVESDGLHFGAPQHSQPIYGFATPIANPDLEALATAANVDVIAGNVAFQLPLFYGGATPSSPWFTTLRIENLPLGEQHFAVTDTWVTSSAIKDAAGTVLLAGGSKLSLADWSALFTSLGNVQSLGFAVQADAAAVVESVTANGTKYVFVPYDVPSVDAVVRVYESEIQLSETLSNYTQWHEGVAGNTTPAFNVIEDGLELGLGAKSQILKGLDAPITDLTLGELVAGAEITVLDGSVTYQIPLFYGSGSFATLHSTDLGAGTHTFDLNSPWRLSSSILGFSAFSDYPLHQILDKLSNVQVIGFGVQTNPPTAPGVHATVSNITFDQTTYVFSGPIEPGTPVITGTPTVGQALTATPGTWAPADTTFEYQWLSDGDTIDGATDDTYQLTGDDYTYDISVVVTGSAPGYDSVAAESDAVAIGVGTLTVATPTITGDVVIGETLTAVDGGSSPLPISFSYQWFADGAAIPGATDATYEIVVGDVGSQLTVKVTGTKAGYTTADATSLPTAEVPLGILTPGAPFFNGTLAVGTTLTAYPGSWAPSGASFTYQWRSGGADIPGATGATYTLGAGDEGATIDFVVTATLEGYADLAVASAAQSPVGAGTLTAGSPTITGVPKVGETLTAHPGTWAPSGVTFTYVWKADGIVIAGATGPTYVLDAAELNKSIVVVVTGSLPGYNSADASSPAATTVAAGTIDTLVPSPLIGGTAAIGETLTVDAGTWLPAAVTLSYRWFADGVPISGATGSTLTVKVAQVGTRITVRVTGTKAGYATRHATSDPTSQVPHGTLTAPIPQIAGDPTIGTELTAFTGTWAPSGVALSYQWLSDGEPILGQTGKKYMPAFSAAGHEITVAVTGTKTGYTTATAVSAGVAIAEDATPLVSRIAGKDRYDTAVKISQSFEPGVTRVYLASGEGFADALSAAPAAAHLDVPLLLTTKDSVPASVLAELERLDPGEIVIVGGPSTISRSVLDKLVALSLAPKVMRIGGADRFEASRNIAEEAFDSATVAYIASGLNFPDALAATSPAAHYDAPVILVNGASNSLDIDTLQALSNLGVQNVTIAGGPKTVKPGIQLQLSDLYTVKRPSGVDRYMTAVKLIEDAFAASQVVYLSTGLKFPDALAGSARAGSEGYPIYLSDTTCIPQVVFESIVKLDPSKIVLLGGTATLTKTVAELTVCSY